MDIKFFVIMHNTVHRDPETDEPLFWNADKQEWTRLVEATVYHAGGDHGKLPRESWGWLELPNTLFEEFQALQYADDAKAAALAEDFNPF